MPPSQKYSGTSQVQTGACMTGPCTDSGIAPDRIARFAAATSPGWGSVPA